MVLYEAHKSQVEEATHKMENGFLAVSLKGVVGGWLVAFVVWLAASARDTISQLMLIWAPVFLIPATGLVHCIAGSTEVMIGIFAGEIPWGEIPGEVLRARDVGERRRRGHPGYAAQLRADRRVRAGDVTSHRLALAPPYVITLITKRCLPGKSVTGAKRFSEIRSLRKTPSRLSSHLRARNHCSPKIATTNALTATSGLVGLIARTLLRRARQSPADRYDCSLQ